MTKVYLAPMEGVADFPMRKVLTLHGGYDECFSEFIRVTDVVLPKKTLIREVPELLTDCKTDANVNVRVQLLGDNAHTIAMTAKKAVSLGAKAIDINFGCPSRFVHHGGAMLLREPELMHEIVATVRETLDESIKLSVKVRTGFLDKSEAPTIIKAIACDGVNEIIVHARTRKDLYKEEMLDWSVLATLHQYANNIPIVANGDILGYESALQCKKETLCDDFMIGRGALMIPNMGHVIKSNVKPYTNLQILQVLLEFSEALIQLKLPDKSLLDRMKQFLGFARRKDAKIVEFFKSFCRINNKEEAFKLIDLKIKEFACTE